MKLIHKAALGLSLLSAFIIESRNPLRLQFRQLGMDRAIATDASNHKKHATAAKMKKLIGSRKPILVTVAAGAALFMLLWSFSPSTTRAPNMFDAAKTTVAQGKDGGATKDCTTVRGQGLNLAEDPADLTFYDDPTLSYEIGNPMENWDDKRMEWLKHHPSFAAEAQKRVFMLTGAQPSPCKNPLGDHLNLRVFKNKVDYCRIHGYDILFNNAILHPQMVGIWAKAPIIRAVMVAHPEAEWIFWVDSDVVITDMDLKLPLGKYDNYNLVVDGWPDAIFKKKSWVGLNAGVFLLRNCQWSMEFLEVWAGMGPQTPNYENWGKIQSELLTDRLFPVPDDQSGMIYLLLKDKKWGDKYYLEREYGLSGYWKLIVDTLDKIADNYARIEKMKAELRRRHAEKVSEQYAKVMAEAFHMEGGGDGALIRPFTAHFGGFQQCSNSEYKKDDPRWIGMEKALNFADNQVLRNYGFVRPNLLNSSFVQPLR